MDTNNLINTDLKWCYYKVRDDKDCDFYKYLQVILESKESYWNYRVALLCLSEKRIPTPERAKYVIRHAEILFENNALEYIIRFLNKIYNKPAYQEYLKTKESIKHYEERLNQQTQKARHSEQKRQEEIAKTKSIITRNFTEITDLDKTSEEKSRYILALEEPEYNYHAIVNLETSIMQKQQYIPKILESSDAYWNYKCIKIILRAKSLSKKEKMELVKPHVEVVFNSNDKEVIDELLKFLKYKPTYNEIVRRNNQKKYSHLKNNHKNNSIISI